MKTEKTATPYEWDFDGMCAPSEGEISSVYKTFTLGVFQWVPRARGKGLKRGKVVYRIKGQGHSPSEAYARAREFVAKKNALEGRA